MLCGSELRKLTAREMLGAFMALSARHHVDARKLERADSDYSLARHLFPRHRQTLMRACAMTLHQSTNVFEPHEIGHMNSFFKELWPPKTSVDVNYQVASPSLPLVEPEVQYAAPLVEQTNPFAVRPAREVVGSDCFSPTKIELKG
jgi:hypothetical protein